MRALAVDVETGRSTVLGEVSGPDISPFSISHFKRSWLASTFESRQGGPRVMKEYQFPSLKKLK
tara:strand:- start:407 stop:598 length:192 start_codon:yes stop_codon:yes gene_type:complete